MIKRTLIYSLLLVILFILGCSNQNAVNPENRTLKETSENINISSINYDNFKELNLEKDNIILKINGKTFNFNLPIYIDKNRYYLPLNEIINNFNGEIKKVEDILYLNIDNIKHSIDTLDNTVKCPNDEFTLKENLLTNDNNIYYIAFSDISHMLNLYTRWDKDNKVINCRMNSNEILENNTFYNHDDNSNTTNTEIKDNNINTSKNSTISENKSQIALIRLEDICAIGQNYAKDYFENLRINRKLFK
ncbi:stalk domain-containing protein [Clostridium neonatale]|uniref:stalk domain-containing protein n=1 Tax=Clostridium neonatale TaxID=137838 RepID=UPI003D32DBDC